MEKLDYTTIDPFCIPVIKYLREEKGVETMYCCQGCTKEDSPEEDHSKRGYIMAKYSEQAFTELLKIFNSHASRIKYEDNEKIKIEIRRHPIYEGNIVLVHLAYITWPNKEVLENEWNSILSDITQD